MVTSSSPFQTFIEQHGFCILDGGLASELEYEGYDLKHPLWSAKTLHEKPDAIRKVHYNFLKAGADCIITSSYQISFQGCANLGFSNNETKALLDKSVAIAIQARDQFLREAQFLKERIKPLIAASIGPYGAYLADGSEYRGDYNISDNDLYDFHIRRWEQFEKSNADLIACETIPSMSEAKALFRIMQQFEYLPVYISFSCRDGMYINDGTPISECAAIFNDFPKVIGIGVNCTAPKHVNSLIHQLRESALEKLIIVYPNSGEIYDGNSRSWTESENDCSFTQDVSEWYNAGAQIIGGCCRIRPKHIKQLRNTLVEYI